MKPELLLSVDSERRFWLDPRTKLYMLVIFSIVMIDGKTDGISFWLKPILALVPFFLLLSGSRKKVAIIYLIVFVVSWMVNIFLVPYMGLIGTIIISLLAQFGTRWFPSAMMGYYLLSTTMQSTVCATKQLYIRDFEVSYKNASGGKKKKRKVLDISDLMIPQGSVVGVVGNNGAGKTTFANNLCGLLKTAKGCMSMNGKTYMANQRIKTCYMVMQDVNHQLFTESVMDEILLSLDNSDEEKAAHEAESIMESLHISEFRDAHPMSLSGGQKQRVAIASAIASDKQVIVFDEPTSGLDYRHMKKVAENLRELSSLGKTLFIVTHDPELIAECCNYFVFIENGKVLWSDGWNRISRERLQRFFAFEGD